MLRKELYTMSNVTPVDFAIKIIAALYSQGLINKPTYDKVLVTYGSAT